jgi:hypothetical protein
MTSHTHGDSDSRDCGFFFLDVVGQFSRDDLAVHWSDQPRPSTDAIDLQIEQVWQEQTRQAKESGRRLYNGRLARLVSYAQHDKKLELNLGPVSFKEFLGTNLTNASMRYQHGTEVLADALGVSAAIITSDSYILLGRRSQQVMFHAGLLHPLGGIVELESQDKVDPFEVIETELAEEAGLDRRRIQQTLCLGLVRDKKIVQPELIFGVTVDVEAGALREQAANAPDSFEHTELVAARNESSSLVAFIGQNFAELTPVAVATLLLHGMKCWGSGWFTAARGYLRKVI